MQNQIENVMTIINYIEDYLAENPDLDTIAAAKLLVFSEKPIMEVAAIAGYESQQAFTAVFKEMYKKTLGKYREEEEFYPLQPGYVLHHNPVKSAGPASWRQRFVFF